MVSRNGSGIASIAERTRLMSALRNTSSSGVGPGSACCCKFGRGFVAEPAFVDHQRNLPLPRPACAVRQQLRTIVNSHARGEPPRNWSEAPESAEDRVLHDIFAEHRVARQVAGEIIGTVEVRQDQPPELLVLAGAGRWEPGAGPCGRETRREEGGGNFFTGSRPILASRLDDDRARHVRVQGTEIAELAGLGESE